MPDAIDEFTRVSTVRQPQTPRAADTMRMLCKRRACVRKCCMPLWIQSHIAHERQGAGGGLMAALSGKVLLHVQGETKGVTVPRNNSDRPCPQVQLFALAPVTLTRPAAQTPPKAETTRRAPSLYCGFRLYLECGAASFHQASSLSVVGHSGHDVHSAHRGLAVRRVDWGNGQLNDVWNL